MKAALVLPGGGQFPTRWDDLGPEWGIQEWGFHTCLDNGDPNHELEVDGRRGKTLDLMRTARIGVVPQNYKIRITRDYHWPRADMSPEGLAVALSEDIKYLNQEKKQCSLGMDIEAHDGGYVLAALKKIRQIRPGRGVFWTMEPNQGGWIKNWPQLISLINEDPLIFVVAQTYDFNMNPYGTADGIRVNMWDAGIKRDKVELYYGLNDRPHPARYSGSLYDWNNFIK